jgi:hypothetical protein
MTEGLKKIIEQKTAELNERSTTSTGLTVGDADLAILIFTLLEFMVPPFHAI